MEYRVKVNGERDKMRTPYYLIHENILDDGIKSLKEALGEYWPNAVVGYSFKTNSLPWILSHMKEQGFWAEVVSEDEYELAECLGYSHIIYNGPVKGKDSFLRACKAGHIVNLDSARELVWLREAAAEKEVHVGIRVNFDLEAMCPGEASEGEEGGRFGFSYENGSFQAALDELKRIPHVRLAGIHLHCSSKTRSLNIYRAIAQMACRIHRECGLILDYIDVGGGFFGGLPDKPQYKDYFKVISEVLSEEFSPRDTCLIVEPGTSLVSAPIDYVTTVIDVKATNRNQFIVTDGSRIHVDPRMRKEHYFYHIHRANGSRQESEEHRQIISGFTCMEDDRLFCLEDEPLLACGDQIVYEKVGAYTMCLSPLFIEYFPAVYLKRGDETICVRERWTAHEYMQGTSNRSEG